MTLTIVALLFLLLVGIYINARMRTARHLRCIAEEKGDIARAMSVVRCVDLAEAYLFPKIMTKQILKEVPETRMGLIRTYGAVIGAMIGGMVR